MKKIGLLTLFLLFSALIALSQDDKKVYEGDFEFFSTLKPRISDGIKLDVVPVAEKTELTKPVIKYNFEPKLFSTTNTALKIPYIVLKTKNTHDFNRYFLKAGYGNYDNLMLDLNYNTINFKDKLFSAHLKHNSGIASLEKSLMSDDLLEFGGQKINTKTKYDGRLFASNYLCHFYGFNPSDSINYDSLVADSIRQNFFTTGFNASISNELYKKAKIKYEIKTSVFYFQDNFDLTETGVGLTGGLEQTFMDNPFRFEMSYNMLNDHFVNTNLRNILDVKANYSYKKENWSLRAGFTVASEGDTAESIAKLYPDVDMQIRMFENKMTLFGGLTGRTVINSFRSVSEKNPFVLDEIELKNTLEKMHMYCGFKGNFGAKYLYNLKLSYLNIENLPLFVNSDSFSNRFEIIYDEGNTNLLRVTFDFSAEPLKNLSFFLNTNFYQYDLSHEFYAWHLPNFDLRLTGKYVLQKKLYFDLNFFVIGKRFTKDFDNPATEIELKPIIDLNAGITYKFNSTFAIFFQFNNLTSEKYYYWNNYPTRGFHFAGGLKLNL